MKSGPGQMKKLNNKGRQREVYKYYCFSVIEWSKKGEEKKSADGSFHDWFLSLSLPSTISEMIVGSSNQEHPSRKLGGSYLSLPSLVRITLLIHYV